ncbi:ankyrin repeat protein [Colletotrichum chrysophilum]|uniref:Ankyrin repeat protein n=1 Tax=Colletotrichum chrysophilum TaxID=1836956 RepID=A0AAD9ARJ0_9PEZI|nr:ankyrin repeat protein [Colletotrichum chrysophilum]
MPRPKRSVISNAKWDRFEPLIRQLYLQDDKTLPEVIEKLHAYDFDPSEAQLESRLKLWHMNKNMSAKQWRYVETRLHQRKCRGKQSNVYLSGIQKNLNNAARNKHLHVTTLQKYNQMYQKTPKSPKDLSLIIRTPPCTSPDDEDIVSVQLALRVAQSRQFLESRFFVWLPA